MIRPLDTLLFNLVDGCDNVLNSWWILTYLSKSSDHLCVNASAYLIVHVSTQRRTLVVLQELVPSTTNDETDGSVRKLPDHMSRSLSQSRTHQLRFAISRFQRITPRHRLLIDRSIPSEVQTESPMRIALRSCPPTTAVRQADSHLVRTPMSDQRSAVSNHRRTHGERADGTVRDFNTCTAGKTSLLTDLIRLR